MELRKRGSWMEDAFGEVMRHPTHQKGTTRKNRGCNSPSEERSLFLWSERFAPTKIEDLVVNRRKVEELSTTIRRILKKQIKSKILLISGPAGSGKLVALKAICRSLGLQVVEWDNDCTMVGHIRFADSQFYCQNSIDRFKQFIRQSTRYRSVVSMNGNVEGYLVSCSQVVVVKDIPSPFYEQPDLLISVLENCRVNDFTNPLVFIATDCSSGNPKFDWHRLFSSVAIATLNMVTVSFNPFPRTVMTKCLRALLSKASLKKNSEAVDINSIVQTADGDLRVAINNLQFSIEHSAGGFTTTRKDTVIPLFRACGKFLYGKFFADGSTNMENDSDVAALSIEETVAKCGVQEHLFCLYLFENYVDHRPDLEDVVQIASSFSSADCLTGWDVAGSLYPYVGIYLAFVDVCNYKIIAGSIVPRSVATFFSKENPRRFKVIRKPHDLVLHKQVQELNIRCHCLSQNMARCLFDTKSFTLDYLSYVLKIRKLLDLGCSLSYKKTTASVEAFTSILLDEAYLPWNDQTESSCEELKIDESD